MFVPALTECVFGSALAEAPKLTHRRSLHSIREPVRPPTLSMPRASVDSDRPQPSPTRKRANTTNSARPLTPKAPKTPKQSRKRSESVVTAETDDSTAAGVSLRGSVSGWMGNLSRSRKSSMSKKNFQSLEDNEEQPRQSISSFSSLNLQDSLAKAGTTPSGSLRQHKPREPLIRPSSNVTRPSVQMRIRALHDLINVTPEELSFRAGDVLTVLDDSYIPQDANVWVRAERNGLVGLVPMNYFELVHDHGSPKKGVSRAPSLRNRHSESASPDETEESDSPSSSLLQEGGLIRRGSRARRPSRSHLTSEESLPDFVSAEQDDYHGRKNTFRDSMSSFEYDGPYESGGLDHGASSGLINTGTWGLEQHDEKLLSAQASARRKSFTAPPSPSRRPGAPNPSPRQLASSLASAAVVAAGKKPPPPPPPARRTQSSAILSPGAMVPHSASGMSVGNGSFPSKYTDMPPPVLPPPRRPAFPVRGATTQGAEIFGVSPFDP